MKSEMINGTVKSDGKNLIKSFISRFKNTKEKKGENNVLVSARAEGKLFGLWNWVLPLLLGIVFGWFGMACLGVWLDDYVGHNRPLSSAAGASASPQDLDAENMSAFLQSNPFKISLKPVPEFELEKTSADAESVPRLTGSLATAIVRWTMPSVGIVLEDQGKQHILLLNESFDVYTLEQVTYRQAIFTKGEERVALDLLYTKETPPSTPMPATTPSQNTGGGNLGMQVIPPDAANGIEGVVSRALVDSLLENPFDELKNVRIRPAHDGQGMEIQWINNDSILAQLGVQKGDVIRSINGITFRNTQDIMNSISSMTNSDRFDVAVGRGESPVSLQYVVR
jgi:type II secretory pathway component PulC